MVDSTSWTALQEQYSTLLAIAEENNKKSLSQISSLEDLLSKLETQVSAKEAELDKERARNLAETDRVKALEDQLTVVMGDRDELAKEKKELLEEVENLKQQLEESTASLIEKQLEAEAACENIELTFLQLHQVQEEMEYYFHQSRGKDELLQKHQIQQQRIKKLISKMLDKA